MLFKSTIFGAIAAAGILLTAPAAKAQMPVNMGDVSVGLGIGSEGIGGQASLALVPNTLNFNIGFSRFRLRRSFYTGGVDYLGKATVGGVPLTLSYFPFHASSDGWLRAVNVTGGMFINQNQVSVLARPSYGTYMFNGHTYTAAEAGSVSGHTNFNAVAPYLGLGWGNPVAPNSHWTLDLSAGVMYEGGANVSLKATGAAANPALAADLVGEQNSINNKLNFLDWWPMVSVGLNYHF